MVHLVGVVDEGGKALAVQGRGHVPLEVTEAAAAMNKNDQRRLLCASPAKQAPRHAQVH